MHGSAVCSRSQLDLLGVSTGVVPRARLAHVLPQLLRQLVVPWFGVRLGVRVRLRLRVRPRLRLGQGQAQAQAQAQAQG